ATAARQITAILGRSAGGLRAEELRKRVDMTRADLGRPMKMLLAAGQVKKTGQKRATVYSLGASGARATEAAKAAGPTSGAKRQPAKTARRSRKASIKARRGAAKKPAGKLAGAKKAPATKAARTAAAPKAATAATNGAGAKSSEA